MSASSSSSNLAVPSHTSPQLKKKRMFTRDLQYMMHGFGDDPNPYSETIELVDDLVVQFITEMTLKSMEVGKRGKLRVEDILFVIRKDTKKYARVKDLLMMNEELKRAKQKFFDDSEYS